MNIAIIGFGYWGPNLVRNFSNLDDCKVKIIAELSPKRLEIAAKMYPYISVTHDVNDILKNKDIDAVIIATPVFTHYSLAKSCLEHDKHVLIEKPMTASTNEALELIEIAAKKRLVLMVDHTFLYTGAVQRIKTLVDKGEIGDLKYIDSTRINLGLFQPDINVIWDLAPHDISILQYIKQETPYSVQSLGISHTHNDIENIAYLTLNYNSNFIAHFNCSWTSPVKIRMMLIGGDKKMIVYNDMEPSEKVKIYDTGYEVKTFEEKRNILVDYRAGDIFVPKVELSEALLGMARDFQSAIYKNTTPISNSELGLSVVKILEAAQISIKNKGKEVVL